MAPPSSSTSPAALTFLYCVVFAAAELLVNQVAFAQPRWTSPFPGLPRQHAGAALDPAAQRIGIYGGIGPVALGSRDLERQDELWVYDIEQDRWELICPLTVSPGVRSAPLQMAQVPVPPLKRHAGVDGAGIDGPAPKHVPHVIRRETGVQHVDRQAVAEGVRFGRPASRTPAASAANWL
jgi:hypothetical protein